MNESLGNIRRAWKDRVQAAAQLERINRYGTLEKLDAALIQELIRRGFTEDDLLTAQRKSMLYSRKQNKLVYDIHSVAFARQWEW